ncbi:reverse transcriptase domain-containing protein [Corynebacterium suedekumii]|uniref:Reverse transcriptase domain-containing protein n=1 Tax=Corynebacterium suedekumii TaxID=3049801 RepID=A0ABY8VPU8_9CORY|nr:reverse transcriptase domain-containing protein [Corynebacterium suedekumii]WIM70189.1 reverse transcriptase domain-containing protein [Corynebacterium suedekumii]
MTKIDWTTALNTVVGDLRKRKVTYRSPGTDGEDLYLYLRPDSLHLMRLKEDLKLQRYKPRPLKVKLIPKKPAELPRAVFIPTNRDYLVARAMKDEILRVSEKPPVPAKQVLRKLITSASEPDIKFSSIARLDIRDFYGSVPYDEAIGMMIKDSRVDNEIISLMQRFSTACHAALTSVGQPNINRPILAPQGLPYAPSVANWYIEKVLKDYTRSSKVHSYHRFVDDILFLFRYDATVFSSKREIAKFRRLLKSKNLHAHSFDHPQSKSLLLQRQAGEQRLTFLGLELTLCSDGKVKHRIPPDVVKEEKSQIWKLFDKYLTVREGGRLEGFSFSERMNFLHYRLLLKSAGCRYQGKTYGFPGYWGFSDDVYAFKSLDTFTANLLRDHLSKEYSPEPGQIGGNSISYYLKTFRKMRSQGYQEPVEIDFDRIGRDKQIQILSQKFGVRKQKLVDMNPTELDLFWHRTLRGEVAGLFSSGYSHY